MRSTVKASPWRPEVGVTTWLTVSPWPTAPAKVGSRPSIGERGREDARRLAAELVALFLAEELEGERDAVLQLGGRDRDLAGGERKDHLMQDEEVVPPAIHLATRRDAARSRLRIAPDAIDLRLLHSGSPAQLLPHLPVEPGDRHHIHLLTDGHDRIGEGHGDAGGAEHVRRRGPLDQGGAAGG